MAANGGCRDVRERKYKPMMERGAVCICALVHHGGRRAVRAHQSNGRSSVPPCLRVKTVPSAYSRELHAYGAARIPRELSVTMPTRVTPAPIRKSVLSLRVS